MYVYIVCHISHTTCTKIYRYMYMYMYMHVHMYIPVIEEDSTGTREEIPESCQHPAERSPLMGTGRSSKGARPFPISNPKRIGCKLCLRTPTPTSLEPKSTCALNRARKKHVTLRAVAETAGRLLDIDTGVVTAVATLQLFSQFPARR